MPEREFFQDRAVLFVGATSGIARAVARHMAAGQARLFLAARDEEEVTRIAEDLRVRHHADVTCGAFEASAYPRHANLIEEAQTAMSGLDGLVVAVGRLGEQHRAERDFDHARQLIEANYTGPASLLTCAANHFEAQGDGFIVGLSSVAGDRGRESNYVYGSAKGALSLFLQGMRSRLHDTGVQVLTVKPGPTDTKMTFGLEDRPPLVASPERVARDVVRALRQGRDVVYAPRFWRVIMTAIRLLPESLFKRLSF